MKQPRDQELYPHAQVRKEWMHPETTYSKHFRAVPTKRLKPPHHTTMTIYGIDDGNSETTTHINPDPLINSLHAYSEEESFTTANAFGPYANIMIDVEMGRDGCGTNNTTAVPPAPPSTLSQQDALDHVHELVAIYPEIATAVKAFRDLKNTQESMSPFEMTLLLAQSRALGTLQSIIEIMSELLDLAMLLQLFDVSRNLAYTSIFFLVSTAVVRVVLILCLLPRVDLQQWMAFLQGALIFLVEPNKGIEVMKTTLLAASERTTTGRGGHGFTHQNDRIAAQSALTSSAAMILLEDGAELVIEMMFAYLSDDWGVNAIFLLSTLTTILHLGLQFYSCHVYYRFLTMNKRLLQGKKWSNQHLEEVSAENKLGNQALVTHALAFGADGAWDELDVTKRGDLNADTIIKVVEACGGFPVKNVHVGGCTRAVTDAMLHEIARSCPKLARLLLSGCSQVSDRGVLAIAEKCHRLQVLSLNRCTKVTEHGIAGAVADHKLPEMTELYLRDCTLVTDQAVLTVAQYCPKLTTLAINRCSRVTNEGVKALAKKCPYLQVLSLSGCPLVTDDGAKTVLEHCLKIKTLDVDGTSISQAFQTEITKLLQSYSKRRSKGA
eukprot:scaffold22063_cov35-Attheya_sp.AAC.2